MSRRKSHDDKEPELTDEEKTMENETRAAEERLETQLTTATQIAYASIQRGVNKTDAIKHAADWAAANAPDILSSDMAKAEIEIRLA